MRAVTIAAVLAMRLASFARAQELVADTQPLPRGSVSGIVRSVTGDGQAPAASGDGHAGRDQES